MKFDFSRVRILTLSLLLLLVPVFAAAQGIVTGSIAGVITDQQGAVVSGAKVTAVQQGTNTAFNGVTDANGAFRMAGLPAGTYSVTVESANFAKLQAGSVVVNANRVTDLGARAMRVGEVGTTIEVQETAPIIETQTSQITNSFQSRAFAELPTPGTGYDGLALLIPGVASAGTNGFGNTNGADLSVNGQRSRSNNFQIDGQSNNDNSVSGPQFFVNNPDLIGEFQVVTNNFSAEYGRNMGSVVNYLTKSGSNSFRGSAFEFYKGNFTDAALNEERSGVFGFCEPGQATGTVTPFTDASGCQQPGPRSRYVDNRFGGTLGGPIWRDKAWFFGSYVMQRIRNSQSPQNSGSNVTPTPAGLAALAAAFPGSPAIETLNLVAPFNIAAGNPQIAGPTQVLNVSNGTTVVPVEFAPVSRTLPQLYNDGQWSVRSDFQITSKDRVFGQYMREDTDNVNATAGTGGFAQGQGVDVPAVTQRAAIDWTRSWTTNLVNQFRVSYSRADIAFEGGSSGCTRAELTSCPSRIQFAGAGQVVTNMGLANNLPQGRLVNNTQFQDNVSLVRGRHTMKFGGEYDRQRSPNTFLPNVNGTYTFSGSGAAGNCAALGAISATPTACAFSNFLANRPSTLNLTAGNPLLNFKEQDMAFYFQDDWRVKDNLTVNLGLRWEWTQQAVNLLHDLSVAQQTGSSPFWDTSLPLDRTTITKLPEDYNNFGPNFGFAWTPRVMSWLFGEGDKTVIRGGFRVAYDPAFYNIFLNVATAAPVVNAGTIPGALVPMPAGGATGNNILGAGYLSQIPVGADPGLRNQTLLSEDFHNPYSQQWSFGLQRSLTSRIALESRYVGNHTVGNFQSINANPVITALAADFPQFIPAGITPCTTAGTPGLGRPDCNRSNVRLRANTAFSIYHGWQNEIRVQGWRGLTSGLSYTWSKAIDNASEIFATASGGTTVAFAANPFDIARAERGVSGNSLRHVASVYFIYDLPMFRNQEGLFGHILGGWQVNGAWRYNSGQPFTPIQFAGSNSYCGAGFSTAFSSSLEVCRPFAGNPNAPIDTVGQCTDPTAADCGIVDVFTGDPTTLDAVRLIYNTDEAAHFFGTPFGTLGRNTFVGQNFNQLNLGVFKNTKITERVTFQVQANAQNILNRQYRGVPDPIIDDFNIANQGSYMNNFFNDTSTYGFGTRRRLELGGKIIF